MLQLKDPSLLPGQCLVAGQWVSGTAFIEVTNPATGAVVASVPRLGAAETRLAIEGANRAWPAWRARTAKERSAVLAQWYALIMANQDDLALIMTSEQGKPLAEARGEIAYAASFIQWFSEEAKRVYGDTIPAPVASQRIVVTKEPIGVCAAGKFQGVMAAQTPMGSLVTTIRCEATGAGMVSPYTRLASSENHWMKDAA